MPHMLGTGLKLWEQLANHPGTGAALIVLCAAMPESRGGGDFDLDANWHGPERDAARADNQIDGCTPGPMPEEYPAIAKRTIGRWAGDRIALIGDYAEYGDIKGVNAKVVYSCCCDDEDWKEILGNAKPDRRKAMKAMGWFKNISLDVAAVIEHELGGRFIGSGWREWKCPFPTGEPCVDQIITANNP